MSIELKIVCDSAACKREIKDPVFFGMTRREDGNLVVGVIDRDDPNKFDSQFCSVGCLVLTLKEELEKGKQKVNGTY